MKTSELKKRVEDMGYDLSYDRFNDNLYIHTQNINERIGYIYLTKQYYFGFNDLSLVTDEIFDLLADYAKTPIDEREDEKLFIVRVPNAKGWYYYKYEDGKIGLGNCEEEAFTWENKYHFTEVEAMELLPDVPKKYLKEVVE